MNFEKALPTALQAGAVLSVEVRSDERDNVTRNIGGPGEDQLVSGVPILLRA